jgi:serine/threonine protein kinase
MENNEKEEMSETNKPLFTFYNMKEETKTDLVKTSYRGYIHSKDYSYYIVNEILSGDNMKIFSAVKFNYNKDQTTKHLDSQRFCIRHISKYWITKEIFSKMKLSPEKIHKFYENLKQSFSEFENIKHKYIQRLYDYIDDGEGIYIVSEFCDWTLKDYVHDIREPLRNTRFPFEIKLRKAIKEIVETVIYLHEDLSLTLGGLLNSADIMVSEFNDTNSISIIVVKLPNPFISNLLTMLKMYDMEEFPSYYAPEVYKLFEEDKLLKSIEKKESFELGDFFSKLNQNFDIWCLGYLLYEILFEIPPFNFDDLKSALSTLNEDATYKIHPYHISPVILKLINHCLQFEQQERIQTSSLKEYFEELKQDQDNIDEVEKQLRARINNKNAKEEFDLFKLRDFFYDKYIN